MQQQTFIDFLVAQGLKVRRIHFKFGARQPLFF